MRRKARARVRVRRDGSVIGKAVAHAFVVQKEAGRLLCTNCGEVISPNSVSMSIELGAELVVSCESCLPGLLVLLEEFWGHPVPVDLYRALFGGRDGQA